MSRNAKPIVLMMPGPLHLFWTNGALYLSELRADFRFVLAVPAAYRGNARFEELARHCNVAEVAYLPQGSLVQKHVRLNQLFSRIARQYATELLLLHNDSYPENQYAIHHARKVSPRCAVLTYQNSRVPLDWSTAYRAQLKNGTIRLVRLGVPELLGRLAVLCYRKLRYWLEFKLLPLWFAGRGFRPLFDVFNYVPIPRNACAGGRDGRFDRCYTLAYFAVEADQLRNAGSPNVAVVVHPVRTAGALQAIYGNGSPRFEILVLPSCDVPSRIFDIAESPNVAGGKLADLWIPALRSLKQRFGGALLGVKLHPLLATDPLGAELIARLRATFPDLQVSPPETPAERLILEAAIIVSDVSATLWWAALLGGKTVVSLDTFGFEGGDQMKHFEGIHYVDDVSLIAAIPVAQRKSLPASPKGSETVREFIGKICRDGRG